MSTTPPRNATPDAAAANGDSSSCDRTRVEPESPLFAQAFRYPPPTAQYRVLGQRGIHDTPQLVATGLPLAEARSLCEALSERVMRLYPGRTFARPYFEMEPLLPPYQQNGAWPSGTWWP